MSSHSTIASKRKRRSSHYRCPAPLGPIENIFVGTKFCSTITWSTRPYRLAASTCSFSPNSARVTTTVEASKTDEASLRQWIILKIVIGVITMIIGAVLALLINVIILNKRIYAVPSDYIIYPEDIEHLELTGKPKLYCQFQHRLSKKCLTITGTEVEKGEPLYLKTCTQSVMPQAHFQTFHYNSKTGQLKIKTVPHPKTPKKYLEACLSTNKNHTEPLIKICSTLNENQKQIWFYTNNKRFFHKIGKKYLCLNATKISLKPRLAPCRKINFKSQQFVCKRIRNFGLFKPDSIHQNGIETEDEEEDDSESVQLPSTTKVTNVETTLITFGTSKVSFDDFDARPSIVKVEPSKGKDESHSTTKAMEKIKTTSKIFSDFRHGKIATNPFKRDKIARFISILPGKENNKLSTLKSFYVDQ